MNIWQIYLIYLFLLMITILKWILYFKFKNILKKLINNVLNQELLIKLQFYIKIY